MSEANDRIVTMMIECPSHEGNFDCTPFCSVCEGNQEYEWTPFRMCVYCGDAIEHDIWFEELGMCVDCSSKYYEGKMD